jgi:transcriptional regulator with XRE-family HTH domain
MTAPLQPQNDEPELGPRLRWKRSRLALRQDDVAAACNVSRETVWRWETSRRIPEAPYIRLNGAPGPLTVVLEERIERLAKLRSRDLLRRHRARRRDVRWPPR